jgi:glycerol-3-phosphate dehydrogenase
MYDVVIIGAGVVGCAIARELSRYQLRITVIDRGSDVGGGTSKANSGIVHAGFDAKAGSLKAKLNVEGNRRMDQLAEELDIPFRRNGSLVLCFSEPERERLESMYQNGLTNQVPGLRILNKDEVKEMEPGVTDQIVAALYAPTGGIICPFTLTIALAENACVNGAEFMLEREVLEVEKHPIQDGMDQIYYLLKTNKGDIRARTVINAAGVYADVFHNMVSPRKIKIMARKGEYCLFDKAVSKIIDKTIFQMPGSYGKGVLVTPTIHGNLMIGPSAADVEDKEAVNTTATAMEEVMNKARRSVNNLPLHGIITTFSGLRAHEEENDFIIGEADAAPGFIDVAGMESPGLSCAPAIGRLVAEMIIQRIPAEKKHNYISTRKGIHPIMELSEEERRNLCQKNPAYANVICRCETITEGEILEAIYRPLGARTLDAVKRRTRAGSGRCQSGFCTPKVMELLARELSVSLEDITKFGGGSKLMLGRNKEIGQTKD